MPNYIVQGSDLSSVASAIRTKGGTSTQLAFPAEFVSAIDAIPTGGGGTNGLVDVAFNYSGLYSGTVSNNVISNYAASVANKGYVFRFKSPVSIVSGDTIKITFSDKTTMSGSYSDFAFITNHFNGTTSDQGAYYILTKRNFAFNITNEISITLSGVDSADIFGFVITNRADSMSNCGAKINIYVNDVLVF